MKKREVLSLLERFPDLVDSDELIQDLYQEAAGDSASSASEAERKLRIERSGPVRTVAADDASIHN